MKKCLSIALTVLLLLSTCIVANAATPEKSVFLFTNDVHCAYEDYTYLAQYEADMKAQADVTSTYLVDVGDAIQGGIIGTLSKGEDIIKIMNFVGYDFAIPGNHEFDYGMDRFLNYAGVDTSMSLTELDCGYYSCNFAKNDDLVLDAYKIFDAAGKKVALVAISTPETLQKSTPTYFQDENGNYIYNFSHKDGAKGFYKRIQDAVNSAKADGADIVVAVGHVGDEEGSEPYTSQDIIANVSGLDCFLDGHAHSTLNDTVTDKDGKPVKRASTGTKLANIGKLVIDENGGISVELVDMATYKTTVDTTSATYIAADAYINGEIGAAVEAKKNEVVAHTDFDLTTMDPATGKRRVRNGETNLGDLCADAYRYVMSQSIGKQVDVGIVNGGGIRADIPAGDITYGQILAVHPFGNAACVVEATGQQILDSLEMSAMKYPDELGGFQQVSGVEYIIDTTVEESPVVLTADGDFNYVDPSKQRRVTIKSIAGEDFNPERIYTVASHNYLLKSGGDGFTMFKGNKLLADEVMLDNEVLISYFNAMENESSVALRNYSLNSRTMSRNIGVSSRAALSDYSDPYGVGRISVSSKGIISTEKKDPTCADGFEIFTNLDDNSTFSYVYSAVDEHETYEKVVKEATEDEEGLVEIICKNCEEVVDSYNTPKLSKTPEDNDPPKTSGENDTVPTGDVAIVTVSFLILIASVYVYTAMRKKAKSSK